MKITELYVDRFGVWNDLALATFAPGLNVIYGPNETGKSTLMRFIRGVLYGFNDRGPQLHALAGQAPSAAGSLRVTHDGAQYELERIARGDRGTLSLSGGGPAEETVERLLSSTSEAMFERLFAVDLLELQELATLGGDELAERVYGLTLGSEGRTILNSWRELSRQQQALFDPADNSGRLAELFRRDVKLSGEIESASTLLERHAVLGHERDELTEAIQRRERRQSQLIVQQRGHRFMDRAWPVWHRMQEQRRALRELPELASFPADGLERLAEIDAEIDSHSRCRQALIAEAKQLRDEAQAAAVDERWRRHAAAVEAACDNRERLVKLQERAAAAQSRVAEAAALRDAGLQELGPDWTAARLEAADTSPAAQLRLLDAARGYHGRLDRRNRIRRRYKLRAASCSRRERELQERRKAGGDSTFAAQIEAAGQRLSQLEELHRLRSREVELEQRHTLLSERLQRIDERPPLPAWAYVVLGFFGILGIVCALFGFYTGLTFNGLMGLMYALLGTACGGTAYALKAHVESAAGDNAERLADETRTVEIRLRETRDETARLMGKGAAAGDPRMPQPAAAELIARQARRLAELERLSELEKQTADRRSRLSERRGKVRQAQRDVVTARQGWCDVLKKLSLTETLRPDEAFDNWRRLLEAREVHEEWRTADRELRACRRPLDDLNGTLARLAGQLGWEHKEGDDPLALLDAWSRQLENVRLQQAERRRLRSAAKGRLREAAGYRRRKAQCSARRAALLVQGGAASREEFEERAACVGRQRELDEALAAAGNELDAICRTEPDLAIAEEDMLAFDADRNGEQLRDIEASLEDIESELQQMFERLGSVKQELADAESDRRGTCLRFNRARLDDELRRGAEEWFALELSARALDALQRDFERNHQPATLAAATKYLTQMTRGRYRNIWTPLGRQRLCVDDDAGRSFAVEQLSGGTREQLFLAIRLAIVHELSQQGIELPMVLDDVFANFDQSRTEAAVETLLEFAAGGQQILLLTCHLHVAHMVDGRGGHAIWLPESRAVVRDRKAG